MKNVKKAAIACTLLTTSALTGNAHAFFTGTLDQYIDGIPAGFSGTASPTAVSVAGMPDIEFTFLANGDTGGGAWNGANNLNGTSPFPEDVGLNIGFAGGEYFFDMNFLNTTFDQSSTDTFGLQYYIDVVGWFSDDQPYRLGDIFAGINVNQNDVYTFSKQIQGVLPDETDPNQDPTQPGAIGTPGEWTELGSVFDETLTTTNNAPASVSCGVCTRFLITDTLQRTAAGGIISSTTNSFTLSQVPEPATLALFGAGLVAAGAVNRRRQKQSVA